MKALVIAPQPFFTPRGTPFSVYYRTLITSELGIPVDLLTYGEGENVNIPGVRIIRTPRFGFLGNVKIGPSLLKLFLDIFIVLWTISLLLRNKYDIVHAHEESIFICFLLKPIFKFKLIYDMHSSLPEQLINFQFTTFKPLIKLFEKLEYMCLHSADATITICPSLYNYAHRIVDDTKKVFLIENSIFDEVTFVSKKTG
ncbi:MAG: glycosyltransferase family 4 protein [Symploca sp. SIO2B6]|nr:glycosyltransferase family 4 protein [Symploca sp. SIO2B6]